VITQIIFCGECRSWISSLWQIRALLNVSWRKHMDLRNVCEKTEVFIFRVNERWLCNSLFDVTFNKNVILICTCATDSHICYWVSVS
jgi:hypothetical protein